MKRFSLFLLAIALVAMTGCKKNNAATNQPTQRTAAPIVKADTSMPGDPVAGEAVYKKICIACHGADGKGNGGVTAADFINDTSRLQKDNSILINSITNGINRNGRIMPAHKNSLTAKEIKDALSYVRKTFQK